MLNKNRNKHLSQRKPVLLTPETEGRTHMKLLPRFLFLLLAMTMSATLLQGTASAASQLASSKGAQNRTAMTIPANSTWYFADGQVGAGFQEYLVLGNPNNSADCTVQVEYLPQGAASAHHVKPLLTKTLTVPHASRVTLNVNSDLDVSASRQNGELISSIVSTVASPAAIKAHGQVSCPGIVAERPMYFTHLGVKSGTDVLGANSASTSFYFADVPTQASGNAGVTSTLSILNPSVTPSVVTALYYASGHLVGTQSVTVAGGGREMLTPADLSLPAHMTAQITATQPVVMERTSFMNAQREGAAGIVSGAVSVVGSQQTGNDWLFAEGNTGNQTQENLVLGNPTTTATVATITLEYANGHTQTVTREVPARSQVMVDVNQLNAHPTGSCDGGTCHPTAAVSAEVTAANPSLVVERQMFFHYQHTVAASYQSLIATGWTDVTGQQTAYTSDAFAEGYVNTGYQEFLVLQNPNAQAEDVEVVLLNGLGHSVQQTYTLPAHSRTTLDISSLVLTSHLAGLHDVGKAYEISMLVGGLNGASFVAERPMYFNTGKAGVQGGTDVSGYGIWQPAIRLVSPTANTGPQGVAVDNGGNVWFADRSTNTITRISVGGNPQVYTVPTANSAPFGIAVDGTGNAWFIENSGNKLGKIPAGSTNSNSIVEYAIPTGGSSPVGIAVDHAGNVWLAETNVNKIGELPAGQSTIVEYTVPTSSSYPAGITADSAGNVWFTENDGNKVGELPVGQSNVVEYTIPTTNSSPNGIVADSTGNVWFTESRGNKIGELALNTTTISEYTLPSNNSNPMGIAVDRTGNVWFTENNTSSVGEILAGATNIQEYALPGSACCSWAIAIDGSENIWVSQND